MHTINDSFWMPFTPNRLFREAPRMLVRASGVHYEADDGRRSTGGAATRETCVGASCGGDGGDG